MTDLAAIAGLMLERTAHYGALVWERLSGELVSPTSDISILPLGFATLVAMLWVMRRRRRPVRALARALFPRRWLAGASARADIGFTVFNKFLAGTMVGWAIVSGTAIGAGVEASLSHWFGPAGLPALAGWPAVALVTVALFLAHEAGYYLDHYLSHRVEWLWQFHRTHHLAETLSPLTAYRVHPVDTIVFYNIVGLSTGTALGVLGWLLPGVSEFELQGTNALIVIALYLVTLLQHSHVWLPMTGLAGRVIMSPAHHQLHHSENPAHHGSNFGSNLALFDWLFGTLLVPTRQRQYLTFGAGPYPVDPHGVTGGLVQPFIEAARPLLERKDPATRPAEA